MPEIQSDTERTETSSHKQAHRVAVFSRCGDGDRFTETLVSVLVQFLLHRVIDAEHLPKHE